MSCFMRKLVFYAYLQKQRHLPSVLLLRLISVIDFAASLFEPRSEKTGLRGFRPGLTQTGLYSRIRWLEA